MAARTGEWNPGRPDYLLVAVVALLTAFGLVAVYSASFVRSLVDFGDPYSFVLRQGIWAFGGAIGMFVMARLDYRRLRPLAVPLMGVTIALLVVVIVMGVEGGGARRWIGVGELTLQPAEFAKLTVTIYLAAWLASRGGSLRSFEHGLVPFVLIIGTVSALILLQPNLGTTLIILAITVTMFWVAGATFLQMLSLFGSGLVAITVLALGAGYRAERITAFLHAEKDPDGIGFQTLQALIAIGNGGVTGLGLGASRAKFFYLPESHTDGIFAIIGEELGLLAGLSLLLLYILLMIRGYQVARRARDEFGQLVATGITTWVAVQAFLNIGGILRVIPLTGVPLPFVSYGSNALAALLLAMGVLVSISRYGNDRGGYLDQHPVDRRPRGAIIRREQEP
ncbi:MULTISPECIES: putative lipid II flippase FtsW [Tepidiforma]|uniref:Probable peptidoglycan glycosyltransferase FtsW n=1 Tax=Tepidiforma bonchosmolovskayae TaxID=2601677 RepID=A0ABX6BYY8_9CHLR|nr:MULTISPECIES: putative lipid II flippase FtsW [Tepidiforma]QFG02107.1 putative lipid II flippase FtsW [Tepidiforma bonchosmolovskayae]